MEIGSREKIKNYNWIENFPSPILNSLSETIDKTNGIISNSNFFDDIMHYESLYRNHFFLTPEMWDEQIYNAIITIRDIARNLFIIEL